MIRCKLVQTLPAQAAEGGTPAVSGDAVGATQGAAAAGAGVGQGGSRVARAVAGQTLSIGRGAACRIFLPDPRVRLEHASIRRGEDGGLYLHASGPVVVDRQAQSQFRLTAGQRIGIGPYDFVVEALEDGAGTPEARLTLSFALRLPPADAPVPARVGVRPGLLTRRRLSWLLGLAVLLVCGAWPLWHATRTAPAPLGALEARAALQSSVVPLPATPPSPPSSPPPPAPGGAGNGAALKRLQPVVQTLAPVRHWLATHGQRLDTFWNPGPLSTAHLTLGQDCRSCHEQPFERVRDAACTQCHGKVGDHVADATIAHTTFAGQRCASCHKEHQGSGGMRVTDTLGCAQCHGAIRSHSPLTVLGNVSDFAREHPPFRLSIRSHDAAQPIQRLRQDAQLRNDTGLRFSHAQHLDAAGIRSPRGPAASGGRVVLGCADCHTPDAAGAQFEPVTMARHCQSCHRLSVDPQASAREVPHARPDQVQLALREIYAGLAVERFPASLRIVDSLLQRPGAPPPVTETLAAGGWVEQRSRASWQQMVDPRNGVCTTCHAVQRGAAPAAHWQVPPIVQTRHWLPASTFSHAQHQNAACQTCHRAGASKQAGDILIPDIQTCRGCHAGARPEPQKVVSQCDSCHVFHPRREHPLLRQAQAGATAGGGR